VNLSRLFIQRPVGTVLLTLGIALAGIVAYIMLPVARLPAVDLPVLIVNASLTGASPADMARSVATPLERYLGVIAGVNQMTSASSTGSTRVILQFDLGRNIDDAAREVQAAINAARVDLPVTLRSNPTYRKRNPAAEPFLILALTSDTRTPGQIYDAVSNVVSQRLQQVAGVGDAELGGGSLPAVRVELNPFALHDLGVSSEDVRAAIQANNANRPKGVVEVGGAVDGRALQVLTPAPGLRADDYRSLIVASRGGRQVRLSDVAQVYDSVENTRLRGMFNGKPAIIVNVTQEPGANLIKTADAIDKLLPQLRAQLPQDIKLDVAIDRTGSIRSGVREVQITLVIAIFLVVVVVGLFLRNLRSALIPGAATVVSLLGTCAAMYALGYSINNLTLMALTVATGFVVDDAIVVLENISRYIEQGVPRRQAALRGAREVGFTVLTISLSLVAVFIPLLFQPGQVGQMFREFAMTLSMAVLISLLISLTTTPMMCAMLLKSDPPPPRRQSLAARGRGAVARLLERAQKALERLYGHALDMSLAAPWTVVAVLLVVVALNVYLFGAIAKGYFPDQDNGQLRGGLRADQSISSTAMADKLQQAVDIMSRDPAMETVVGFSGGLGGGFLSAALKPPGERKEKTTREVVNRLRPQLNQLTGLRVFLNPVQELRGPRQTNSTYQFTLKAETQDELKTWVKLLSDKLKSDERLTDVDDDQTENGVETYVEVDRERAAQLGMNTVAINSALYNAFGQRSVATMYADMNQYYVVMEWAPEYAKSPIVLQDMYVPGARAGAAGGSLDSLAIATGTATSAAGIAAAANPGQRGASVGQPLSAQASNMVPLSAFARVKERAVPTMVWHDNGELSSTLSFNLADGISIEEGRQAVRDAVAAIGMPNSVRGEFSGAAAEAEKQQQQQWVLIVAAIVVIYIVLGILYESLIHPITVLTTLPSAGFGAFIALMAMRMEFSIMALIGVFLLIGIVKKNAILIIDFALEAQRARGISAKQAAHEAALLRFRPIMMTTLAAGLGALPLAIGFGQGSELRQPLGVTIIGGLIASQMLTLLTTPVIYMLLDKLRRRPAHEALLARAAA